MSFDSVAVNTGGSHTDIEAWFIKIVSKKTCEIQRVYTVSNTTPVIWTSALPSGHSVTSNILAVHRQQRGRVAKTDELIDERGRYFPDVERG